MADVQLQGAEGAGGGQATPQDSQSDTAWLLAAQAKPRLNVQGFADEEIEEWAEAYVREVGAGDMQGFIAWLVERQRG